MAAPTKTHAIIVGGGLAGLMTAVKVAEAGGTVDMFSLVPVKRSHSVCAQGGINGAVNTKGEGDSPAIHLDDTCYGGDFLANQTLVKNMCDAAPGIINLLDRMGVMFNRTPEGLLDFRRFGGTLHHRTAYAGATTGQQLLYALDEQVRRWEVAGKIRKFEFWEFLGIVREGDSEMDAALESLRRISTRCRLSRLQVMLLSLQPVDLALCSVNLPTQPSTRGPQRVPSSNKAHIMQMASSFRFTQRLYQATTSCV